mmetsp:Transcript_37500/g.73812  ORF Transcript_37500/g.73812 Transcript_37500/m.73812 type:complete len:115 (+) Transcript_37500:289-633(+)
MRPSFLLRQAIHLCLQLQERRNAFKLPNHMFCANTNRFIDVALVHFQQKTLDLNEQTKHNSAKRNLNILCDMHDLVKPLEELQNDCTTSRRLAISGGVCKGSTVSFQEQEHRLK